MLIRKAPVAVCTLLSMKASNAVQLTQTGQVKPTRAALIHSDIRLMIRSPETSCLITAATCNATKTLSTTQACTWTT